MSVRESLQNKWTLQVICEVRVDWLKFDELSNGDQQLEMLMMRRALGFHHEISSYNTKYRLIRNELSTLVTQVRQFWKGHRHSV